MGGIRDIPLTEYVKIRLRELTRGEQGRKLVHLEADAGVSKGFFSQILGGTAGVGPQSGAGLAKILGLADYHELHDAAYRAWREGGQAAYDRIERPDSHTDPEVARAIKAARALDVSREAISEALAAYPNVTDKPWHWWTARIGEYVDSTDRRIERERIVERKTQTKVTRKRRGIRGASEELQKQRAPRSTRGPKRAKTG